MISEGHQAEAQEVLSCDNMDAGVMVNFLKEVHLYEDVRVDCEISPVDVPVSSIVVILYFPI